MCACVNNIMESLVKQRLDTMLDKLDCCTCDKCKSDITAYVLNHIPTKYVATHTGELYSRLDSISYQSDADLTSIIIKASQVIKSNPHH